MNFFEFYVSWFRWVWKWLSQWVLLCFCSRLMVETEMQAKLLCCVFILMWWCYRLAWDSSFLRFRTRLTIKINWEPSLSLVHIWMCKFLLPSFSFLCYVWDRGYSTLLHFLFFYREWKITREAVSLGLPVELIHMGKAISNFFGPNFRT